MSNGSPFDDLIGDLVHPNLILKIFTTHYKVGDILFNSTSTKQPVSMTSPYVFLKFVPRRCSICRFAWAKFPRANITPVLKANTMENVENYRSISLLQKFGQTQGKNCPPGYFSHVSPLLSDEPHSFVKGRSFRDRSLFIAWGGGGEGGSEDFGLNTMKFSRSPL